MNRRAFLRRAAIVASGVVAADQLELLDRLGWVRRLFPGWSAPTSGGITVVTRKQWDALLCEEYVRDSIVSALHQATPFKKTLRSPERLIKIADAKEVEWIARGA